MKSLRDMITKAQEEKAKEYPTLWDTSHLKKYFLMASRLHPTNDAFLWKFRVDLIEEMEHLRCYYIKRYNEFIKLKWNAYLKKCLDMGLHTIYSVVSENLVHALTFSKGSILEESHALGGYDKTIKFRIMDDTDLPLYINDTSLGSEVIAYIRKRFDGKERKWDLRPELVHEYSVLSRRQRRIYTVMGYCNYIIKQYVIKHYLDDRNNSVYVKLVFGCREYLFHVNEGEVNWILTPETKIISKKF
jgi:hypothetical protein